MSSTRWGARRRALTMLAPYLSDDDVEAAARALAAEAGLEVATVLELHELDGDEDAEAEPHGEAGPTLPSDPDNPHDVGTPVPDDGLADDPMELSARPVGHVATDASDEDEDDNPDDTDEAARAQMDEQAMAERRRALLAESDELLAKGRQWRDLTATKETRR
ncbi:hypothetical protein [Isoptericola sp. NPDC057191]|uniref:hypothetical protein n=1 Tax=Isoptericola sp. NPDC057191 TaxID=3346041 RepID=UPI0036452F6A